MHSRVWLPQIARTVVSPTPVAVSTPFWKLTTPVRTPMKQLFKVYSHTVLPVYGRLVSRDTSAYSYLTATIEAFPQGERMVDILLNAGFAKATFRRLTFGICTMYVATK